MDNDGTTPDDTFVLEEPEENEQICNEEWKGNCFCDNQNNNEECDYDDGDCCRFTCEANFEKKTVIEATEEGEEDQEFPQCPIFDCTDTTYNCKNPAVTECAADGCTTNNVKGQCLPFTDTGCLSSQARVKEHVSMFPHIFPSSDRSVQSGPYRHGQPEDNRF